MSDGAPLVDARVRLRVDGSAVAAEAAAAGRTAGVTMGKSAADTAEKAIAAGVGKGAKSGAGTARDSISKGLQDGVKDGLATPSTGLTSRVKNRFGALGRDVGKAFSKELTAAQLDALDSIGNRMALAGAGLAGGFALATKSFMDFDKTMSEVGAATQANAAQLNALREAALQAGADTQYSATEAAQGIVELGKAGVGTSDVLSGGLTGALALAASGQMSVADASEAAATALTQFQLSGKDVTHVADVYAAAAGKAQGSVADLALGMSYVGPVANGLGISLEETAGTLALFASNGLLAEKGGTGLRGTIASLIGPSDDAAGLLADLGIQVYDTQGKFIGMAGVADQLQQAFQGVSDAERNAAFATIFGRENLQAANILYREGAKGVRDWTAAVDDQGFATEYAGKLMNNLSGDIEQLQGSIETTLIRGGSGANDGLRLMAKGATEAVNAFGALPEGLQQITVVGAGVAGAVLLVGGAAVKGAVGVRKLRTDVAELGITAAAVDAKLGRFGVTTERLGKAGKALGGVVAASGLLTIVPDITRALDAKSGKIGDDVAQMTVELANFGKGADLAGESAKVFGTNLQGGIKSGLGATQDLKSLVNDLSGVNGFFGKDLPGLPSLEASQIKAYSEALANLATKDMPTAAAAFTRLAKDGGLTREETQRLLDLMPEFQAMLSDQAAEQIATGKATAGSADAMSVLQSATKEFGTAADSARAEVEELNKALQDEIDKAAELDKKNLTLRDAQRGYQEALVAANESLKENGKRIGNNTEQGRANEAALDGIASATLDLAEKVNTGADGQVKYERTLRAGRAELVRTAIRMGYTKGEAIKLADKILAIPKTAYTKSGVLGFGTFMGQTSRIIERINAINGSRIQVYADAPNVREGRSTGGWIPGAPSEVDSQTYKLAAGEFVVRSKYAGKYADLLEAINEGRQPRVPQPAVAAAGGGSVSGGPAMVDSAAIAAAVAQGVAQVMAGMGSQQVVLDGRAVGQLVRTGGRLAGVDAAW